MGTCLTPKKECFRSAEDAAKMASLQLMLPAILVLALLLQPAAGLPDPVGALRSTSFAAKAIGEAENAFKFAHKAAVQAEKAYRDALKAAQAARKARKGAQRALHSRKLLGFFSLNGGTGSNRETVCLFANMESGAMKNETRIYEGDALMLVRSVSFERLFQFRGLTQRVCSTFGNSQR